MARQACRALFVAAAMLLIATMGRADDRPAERDERATAAVEPVEQHTKRDTSPEEIDRWVAQLGDPAFGVRTAAAEQLLMAGGAASAALDVASDSYDPEIRAAARRLRVLIARGEFERRLADFAADRTGEQGEMLPGWAQFRALAGDDQESRELFVEMQRAEGAMIAEVFASASATDHVDPTTGAGADRGAVSMNRNGYSRWEERLLRRQALQMIDRSGRSASQLGSRVAMLFLAAVPEGKISDAGAAQLVFMLQQPPLREAVTAGPHHEPIRRLLAAWILHCPNNSHEVLKQRLDIASVHELREALPLALAVAHGDPDYITVPPITKATAILLVGQLGGAEHVAHLEPLLEDESLCSVVRVIPAAGNLNGLAAAAANVEVRDVALATMLHLTGQDPADYGFTHAVRQPPGVYNLASLYMENNEKRQAAAEKWRAWRSQQSRAEQRASAGDGSRNSS